MGKGSFWDEIMGGYYDPPLCDGRRKTESVCLGVGSVERPAPFFGAMSRISEAVPASKPKTGRNFRRGRRPLKRG